MLWYISTVVRTTTQKFTKAEIDWGWKRSLEIVYSTHLTQSRVSYRMFFRAMPSWIFNIFKNITSQIDSYQCLSFAVTNKRIQITEKSFLNMNNPNSFGLASYFSCFKTSVIFMALGWSLKYSRCSIWHKKTPEIYRIKLFLFCHTFILNNLSIVQLKCCLLLCELWNCIFQDLGPVISF